MLTENNADVSRSWVARFFRMPYRCVDADIGVSARTVSEMELVDLSADTRLLMIDEIKADIEANKLYASQRLTEEALRLWPEILLTAAASGTCESLVLHLQGIVAFRETEISRGKTKTVPFDAAVTLSEGQFNHFYMRAVCRLAISMQISGVQVYRAKAVSSPRTSSVERIGLIYEAADQLRDLRENGFLAVMSEPNSGLSLRVFRLN
jgi:hypothetical protein